MDEQDKIRRKKAIEKSGWMVAIGLVLAFIITIGTFYSFNIYAVTVHVGLLVALMFLWPLAFFFLGMSVVWRKKFYPLLK